nr:LOW QUALITY PROTEIN: talin-1-like [Crassostrea gigas]
MTSPYTLYKYTCRFNHPVTRNVLDTIPFHRKQRKFASSNATPSGGSPYKVRDVLNAYGISNHEEYSLVREMMDDEKEKTLTLRRDKSIAKDQKKLDEMKKKLHTDDELEWLDHSRTLREQGVLDVDTLLLRRKFFFSDRNVDQRDPVQLHRLYIQSAICTG